MKLLFADRQDIFNTWGKPRFGATPIRELGTLDLESIIVYSSINADGTCDIFHCRLGHNLPFALFRSTTADGVHFHDTHAVLERSESHWHYAARMMYSPDQERYVFMKNALDPGLSMYVFDSRDGETWTEYDGNPVFHDGDAWGAVWSSPAQKYLYYGKGMQRASKRVNDLHYNTRRVVTLRSSEDGFVWHPDTEDRAHTGEHEIFNNMRISRGRLVPVEHQITPDPDDPPDLEFYSACVFEYEDRYFMQMNNYAGSFIEPGIDPMRANGHGAFLGCERWISRDAVNWSRPFRDQQAGEFVTHNPMQVDDMLLFQRQRKLVGLPKDRLTFVTSTTNCVFETREFEASGRPLLLNAQIPGDQYDNQGNQAYVMVELIDDLERVVDGYERDGCLLQAPLDSGAFRLRWTSEDGKRRDGTELAGRRLRARFYARAAYIYALCA